MEIDHVVALKEAWESGAYVWDNARQMAFGNDLTDRRSLAAVTSSSNQPKSDSDPSSWLPPPVSDQFRCIGDWIAIKARWGLSMDHPRTAGFATCSKPSAAASRSLRFHQLRQASDAVP